MALWKVTRPNKAGAFARGASAESIQRRDQLGCTKRLADFGGAGWQEEEQKGHHQGSDTGHDQDRFHNKFLTQKVIFESSTE
jgi:hypothetical protein